LTLDGRSLQFQQDSQGKMFPITGSDLHVMDSSYAWTVLKSPLNATSILAELKAGRSSFLLDAGGTRLRAYPDYSFWYKAYAPIGMMAEYVDAFIEVDQGMYDFHGGFCQPTKTTIYGDMIGWWILYIVVGLIFVHVSLMALKWGSNKATMWWHQRKKGENTKKTDDYNFV